MLLHLYCIKLSVMGEIKFFLYIYTLQFGLCETEMDLIMLVSWNMQWRWSEDLDIVAINIQMHSWRFKVLSEKNRRRVKNHGIIRLVIMQKLMESKIKDLAR